MKALLTTAVLALSLNAFAVNANSSWTEIMASYKTAVQFPQVSFLAGQVTSLVSVDQVCYTQAGFQTIKAQPVYAHTNNEAQSIVQVGTAVLKTGFTFNRYLAINDSQFETVVEEIPFSYNLEVRAASNGDHEGRVLFTKVYNVPACDAKAPVAPIAH